MWHRRRWPCPSSFGRWTHGRRDRRHRPWHGSRRRPVVLTWNVAAEVVAQQREFAATGGTFYAPLPTRTRSGRELRSVGTGWPAPRDLDAFLRTIQYATGLEQEQMPAEPKPELTSATLAQRGSPGGRQGRSHPTLGSSLEGRALGMGDRITRRGGLVLHRRSARAAAPRCVDFGRLLGSNTGGNSRPSRCQAARDGPGAAGSIVARAAPQRSEAGHRERQRGRDSGRGADDFAARSRSRW